MTASHGYVAAMARRGRATWPPVPPPTAVPADRSAWAEEIFAAVALLPALQARTLQLAYGHGLSFRDIADSLDVTVREATTAASEGLRRLGEAIGVAGQAGDDT